MTTYFTIEFIFNYESINEGFVEKVYQSFFNNGFKFSCAESKGDKDLTIEEIIKYNQQKLVEKNELTYDNNASDYYKAIFLTNSNYEHIKLSWLYENNYIFLDMVIPEDNLFEWKNNKACYHKNKLYDLVNLCTNVWKNTEVELIHTQWELDSYENYVEITDDLSFNPFSIIKNENYEALENKKPYQIIQDLDGAKVLMIKNVDYS